MVTRIKCGISCCYLLTGKQSSVLIDTCSQSAAFTIYEKVKNKNVRLILLTHGHPDHSGSAAELAHRLHAPVAMSREDVNLLGNASTESLQAHTVKGRILKLFSKGIMKTSKDTVFSPDIWVVDGQDLSEYGVDAKVIALPGHTKGSVGVLTKDREFFIGDAMFNLFRTTEPLVYEDRDEMAQSVIKIAQIGAKRLWFGHGKPVYIMNS